MALLEKNIQAAHQSLKDTKNLFISGGPEAYFAKMEEDTKTNKYLAQENLPLVSPKEIFDSVGPQRPPTTISRSGQDYHGA